MLTLVALTLGFAPTWTEPHSRELALYPFTAKLNTVASTRQFSGAARLLFPIYERISLMAFGSYAYGQLDQDDGASLELVSYRAFERPMLLYVTGAAVAGFEIRPLSLDLWTYGDSKGELSVVLHAGGGAAQTRIELGGANAASARTFGDVGWRFAAQLGAGLRFRIAEWVSVRLEVDDLVMAGSVDRVNGCSEADLKNMDIALRGGSSLATASVSSSCNPASFSGTSTDGRRRSDDVPIAFAAVKQPAAATHHVVTFNLGLGVTF